MRIDHVVVAVAHLDSAARRYEAQYGLASVDGGVHPGWGTGNRIVPLGESYLELLGSVDEAAAAANPFGRAVLVTATEHGRLSNWCVAPVGLDAEAARLGLQSVSGSRVRPDGTRLQWRSMGLDESIAEPSLPFFIEWQVEPRLHPGRGSAEHRTAPTGIAWVEVSGDPARIRGWLGEESAGLPIRIVAGPPAMLAVGIGTASGEVVIR